MRIFRTGHAYRRRVYHADHHNPAVLPLITKTYLVATGRAFVRLQPTGVASSMAEAKRRRYAALGYEASEDDVMSVRMFVPADAAKTIFSRFTEDLDVTLHEATTELRADLAWRTAWADEMLKDLLGELSVDRLEWSLRWGEFWTSCATNDDVVRFDREIADTWHQLVHADVQGGDREQLHAQLNELEVARATQVRALWREFSPAFRPSGDRSVATTHESTVQRARPRCALLQVRKARPGHGAAGATARRDRPRMGSPLPGGGRSAPRRLTHRARICATALRQQEHRRRGGRERR
jgi:hypothetical protein